jgi:hypothetical protein
MYFVINLTASGAAVSMSLPTFSTITATAILGLSTGANPINKE